MPEEDDPPPPPMEVLCQEPQELEYDPPPPRQPQTPVRMDGPVEGTPRRPQPRTPAIPDIEMLTPTPGCKHRRIPSQTPPPPLYTSPLPQKRAASPLPPDIGISTSQGRGYTTGPWTSTHHFQISVAPLPANAQRVEELAEFLEPGGNGPPPPFHLGRHWTSRHRRIQRRPINVALRTPGVSRQTRERHLMGMPTPTTAALWAPGEQTPPPEGRQPPPAVLVQVTWPRSASTRKVTRVKDGSIRVPFPVL